MLRLSLVFAASVMLLSIWFGTAAAADLPEPPAYAPPPMQFSWTGFYIGGNAGYGWTSGSGTVTTTTGSGTFSGSANGFLGGAQAGYNWQTGAFVFGAEADFQGALASAPFNVTAGPTISGTAKNPWFATGRGRLGYAFDRLMLYATAGGVFGDNTLSGTESGFGPFSSSATYWSWTAGLGAEVAFWNCWSAKAEYLYVGSPSSVPSVPTATSVSGRTNTNIARVGINYHF
jgi:outer membrane immunogenic protein